MPVFDSSFLSPVIQTASGELSHLITGHLYPENFIQLYVGTWVHLHTLPVLGYSRMQKSSKVKDESAFYHSTLYAGS